MTAQLVLRFDNSDDLIRVLEFLKQQGLDKVAFKPKPSRKKNDKPVRTEWAFGIGNLGGKLDNINLRDFAYAED